MNNKSYVGQSRNQKVRQQAHFGGLRRGTHGNNYLLNAYKKYGKDNFVFEIIEDDVAENDLYGREQYWISHLKTCDGRYGYNLSNAKKSKIDIALLWNDPEFRKTQPVKISETMKELSSTDEAKARLTEISNKYWGTEEAKNKTSKRMLNVWASLPEDERNKRIKRFARPREIINYVTFKNIKKPLIEWSELSGIPRSRLLERLKRGITGEKLFAPLRKIKPKPEFVKGWLDGNLLPVYWKDPEYEAKNLIRLKKMTRKIKFNKMKRVMAKTKLKDVL